MIFNCVLMVFIQLIVSIQANNSNFKSNHKMCNLQNIFEGRWVYSSLYYVPDNVFKSCPKTLESLSDTPLRDQPGKYSCTNSSYFYAKYHNPHCTIKPIHESLKELQGKKISFLGDSIMGQLYIAVSCAAERLGFRDKVQLHHLRELFLRPDFPCDPRCLTNSTYLRLQLDSGLVNRCWQCAQGVQRTFDDSYEWNPHDWPTKIRSSNTSALIIGIGAWYNYYQNLISPTDTYAYTLIRNLPILQNLAKTGIKIYWLDTPPMPPCNNSFCKQFGWELFKEFDMLAKTIFEPTQITFLNTSQAVAKRKFYDFHVSIWDLLHWCNPGVSTIPEFLGQLYLHLLTESWKEENHNNNKVNQNEVRRTIRS